MVLDKLFGGLFKKKDPEVASRKASAAAPTTSALTTASTAPSVSAASNNSLDSNDDSPDHEHGGIGVSSEYEFIKELGKGATAVVKLCRRKGNNAESDNQDEYDNLVALKEFKTSLLKKIKEFKREGRRMVVSTAFDKVQIEIAIMKKLSHPNLVSLEAVLDDGSELLILVLEYAPFGQVMNWDNDELLYKPMLDAKILGHFPTVESPRQYAPNGFPEHIARTFFRELIDGLEYLHANNICHRWETAFLDLKPENILVGKGGLVKIADFGVAHFFDESKTTTDGNNPTTAASHKGFVTNSAGTYAYMAPESLVSEPYSAFVADIWALGVTMYALFFGKIPYYSPDVTELFEMIQTMPVDIPEAAMANPDVVDLLQGLLEKDPSKRLTFSQMRVHPWVNEGYEADAHAFQNRCHDTVEISDHDVEHALTKISSFSTITTMKIRGKKWADKARAKTHERHASNRSIRSEESSTTTPDDQPEQQAADKVQAA
ncbi:Aste57867_24998 [Aphanomyces stellatus]|uniref:Aste57867_24998 protein n=1 Tax=Aphanomyces stellatus TaxID=120398 RepID=A0A485LSN9_9STRA|nr:hypothetical protein As57867_024920 [Aphanomyces stellatus]VFU01629.1 Aste57867_24998 [Aphanomyces stellatus]